LSICCAFVDHDVRFLIVGARPGAPVGAGHRRRATGRMKDLGDIEGME
jgi:hypothetical protein